MDDVVRALKRVVKSGSTDDLQKAEALLVKMDPTFTPSIPPNPEASQKRQDKYAGRTVNFAKCAGDEHGKDGDEGKLKCTPKEGSCPDTLGPKGIFVLTSSTGTGFCAPWVNQMSNKTSLQFNYKSNDGGDNALGSTFVTKSVIGHPDTADRKV